MAVYPRANDGLHHGQMLQILVSLEQRIAGEEFNQNAANAPNIARERPPQSQDDLGRSIVPSRHHRRMILILKSGGPEIDQPDFSI